jgi:hydrogenase/urease accessory protein HupE
MMRMLTRVFLFVIALAFAGAMPGRAFAHSTTYAVYSKYEATTSGQAVAFVFALDKASVLQLLERDAPHAPNVKVEPAAIADYRAFFSKYLFERFFVSNGGDACAHPAELGRFFWDEATSRVVAVTKYECKSALTELTIRSLVTHDMPTSHELVGDLQHGHALVRSFFFGDNVEDRISIASLRASGDALSQAPRQRGKFSYVAMPDRQRRYEDLARAELGADIASAEDAPTEAVNVRPSATLMHFIGQGILHIFTGYDHVLFIVTLMLVVGSWRQLAIIVTSFTAAHTITLVVATLGLVTLPSRLIEPLIAASVLFVAVDAVVRPAASARAWVTFGFGLVHGFGLSSVLRALGLSGRELVPALLGFNVGVEIGQLLIVAPLFPLVLMLRKRPETYARARNVLCASVAVVAVFWIVTRVFEASTG